MNGYRCSRCGCKISLHEYLQSCKMYVVVGTPAILHFCSSCIELINEGSEDAKK